MREFPFCFRHAALGLPGCEGQHFSLQALGGRVAGLYCGEPCYRRRTNIYAKNVEGLQRSLTVQRLVHNWVRPHWGLDQGTTPTMAMGLYHRPVKMEELLCWRGFPSTTS